MNVTPTGQRNHVRREARKCPGCRKGECARAAILCRKCFRSVPVEISQWLGRAENESARVAAVKMILAWIGSRPIEGGKEGRAAA